MLDVVVVGTRNNTHNTIQLHTLLDVVVVGTRNNTHNTIQLHTLLDVVVVGTRNNTHNTIQLHTLLDVVVVGTRNNTHNTIQLHTLLDVVVVGTRNNTHNTIQLHTLLDVVVVGTRNNTHNTIQLHTLLMLLLCVTYEPSYITANVQTLCWSKTSPSFSGAHSSCISISINTIFVPYIGMYIRINMSNTDFIYLKIWCDSVAFCQRGLFCTHPVCISCLYTCTVALLCISDAVSVAIATIVGWCLVGLGCAAALGAIISIPLVIIQSK